MRKRSIRDRVRRQKTSPVDLDITSLLDILVILLVFLLKSYNSSGIIFNVPEGIKLPISESRNVNTAGVIIQVSPAKIWVDDKIILDGTSSGNRRLFDQGGLRVIPLFNELVSKKRLYQQTKMASQQAKKFQGIVNLVVDKSIKYSFIRKILHTCAEAGYQKYKFVVMSNE